MSSSLTFYGGWIGVALVGLGYWYMQRRGEIDRQTRLLSQRRVQRGSEGVKDGKPRKQRKDVGHNSGGDQETASARGPKNVNKSGKAKELAQNDSKIGNTSSASLHITPDSQEASDHDFARELSKAKSGTLLTNRTKSEKRQKSVKQSKAHGITQPTLNTADDNELSSKKLGLSSGAGLSSASEVDADDDLSAASSPNMGATTQMPAVSGGDVSDMLEAPVAGPAILRLTQSATPQHRAPAAAKPPALAETKKQRQNRQKAESAKLAREEDEKQRRLLMEKQRRAAREAEGRAAKDGSSFMASKAPSSAWSAPASTANSKLLDSSSMTKDALLDTYDPATNGATTQSFSKATTDDSQPPKSVALTSQQRNWSTGVPSEEEQMRLLSEETDNAAWEPVVGKKGRKGKKPSASNDVAGSQIEAIEGEQKSKKQSVADTKDQSDSARSMTENVPSQALNGKYNGAGDQSLGRQTNGTGYKADQHVKSSNVAVDFGNESLEDSEWTVT